MAPFAPSSTCVLAILATAGLVLSDSNDWVNIDYVLNQARAKAIPDTARSRQSIVAKASDSAQQGPWSIVAKNGLLPPSGDAHDYLSWAPYHWPDCNFCGSKGSNHLARPGQGGNGTHNDPNSGPEGADPYENGGDDSAENGYDKRDASAPSHLSAPSADSRMRRIMRSRIALVLVEDSDDTRSSAGQDEDGDTDPTEEILLGAPTAPAPGVPTLPTSVPSLPTGISSSFGSASSAQTVSSSSSSPKTVTGTPTHAMAPAKTGGRKGTSSQEAKPATTTKKPHCTSTTTTLAPSATWTRCPYVVRDGQRNPDVASLPGPPAVSKMAQSVLYNAIASTLQNSRTYSRAAVSFIDTFFLSPKTAMNPHMNFGQQVRGPGKEHQMGTFTGILDLRGIVKVVNGIQLLKGASNPDWTPAMDAAMKDWMRRYIVWLENSSIGKQILTKGNNHRSFFVSQLAAAKMLVGDAQGATSTLLDYFKGPFLDQIASSGEQPFEAKRTKPYHYRCFNLEAMITNAKIGDQLGLNLWTMKSKYGATIQTALDFAMVQKVGEYEKESAVADIFPHVAAVAAAYGDPKGKYAAFLNNKHKAANQDYKTESFWFYDQPAAMPHSSADGHKHRRQSNDTVAAEAVPPAKIPFECPAVFQSAKEVEVEDGLFVTCDDLKPYYELPLPVELRD